MRHSLDSRLATTSWLVFAALALALVFVSTPRTADARPGIRAAFFVVYPTAVGTRLDNLPSISGHCGVCHYRFTGGGDRNPYGVAVGDTLNFFPNTDAGRQAAVASVKNYDSDADGVISDTEILDHSVLYTNTPTFPGLTAGNVGLVTNVNVNDILAYLTPTTGGDTTPPTVTVNAPNGGESWTAGTSHSVTWTATDNTSVTSVDVYFRDGAVGAWKLIGKDLANSGILTWWVPNTPTAAAKVRVVARDALGNAGTDSSNAAFTIVQQPGGIVPTTLRDFDQPGTQPFGGGTFTQSADCATCHGGFDPAVEPARNFKGSMMAQAGRDPIFFACVTIAEQDAPGAGDLCLRCHMSFGWMAGRSQPTDGSQMIASDRDGVSCDLCHRMVDPIHDEGVDPVEDLGVLALLTPSHTPNNYAGGQFVVDPDPRKRGPFTDAQALHPVLASEFHRSSDFCGTCHDVSNPAFNRVSGADYAPGPLDAPPTSMLSSDIMPLERTYSEWKNSAYPTGVYAPEFAGNKPSGIVSTCQDCHMRDVLGKGCNDPAAPTRPDLPLHDMTGGNSWMPGVIGQMYPGETDPAALAAASARAVETLRKAATVDLTYATEGDSFRALLTVTNKTGHKLPTGYPEGRRMFLQVTAYDANGQVVYQSGGYDPATGVLSMTPPPVVYETHLGISPALASAIGMAGGPSFHFALNDTIYKDNRIPPLGFTNAAFETFGGAPVDHDFPGPGPRYPDGQNWDSPSFPLPASAVAVTSKLYYQTTSKEYVEFLRDENTTNSIGLDLHYMWTTNGRAAPVLMDADSVALNITAVGDGEGAPAAPRLAVLANPFSSSLSFRLELGRPTAVRVEIFDVNGRRVASREYGTLGGGAHRLTWDGRDVNGRQVATGMFWARIHMGDQQMVRQVVRVK
ncbi:MAG TPA: FlgD immunoglobulin-like domain containing protein [Candidatus Eisenbacteria bacterium]|nr:FlgD immunoglobulin-like domain containing protein [Candidatus Eisenbacteria bacterium]